MCVPQKSSYLTLFLKFSAVTVWKCDSKWKFPVLVNIIESVFSSMKCFGTKLRKFASIFVPWYWLQSCFLFGGMVQNRISRVCFYFYSTIWNSKHFSLPRNGSEQDFERFCSAEQPEFRRKKTICFVYSIFPGIIFFWKLPTLSRTIWKIGSTPVTQSKRCPFW